MALFKIRKSVEAPGTAPVSSKTLEEIRLRAIFRLIGSAVLVAAAIIGFPLVFDSQPRPIAVDVSIDIPDKSKISPLAIAKALPVASSAAPPIPAMVEEKAPEIEVKPTPAVVAAVSEAVAEPKIANKSEFKSQPKAEPKLETKPATKEAAKSDDGAKVLALLEGKASESLPVSRFVVQVGAFADPTRAKDARSKLESAGLKTYTQIVETKEGQRTRVRVGPLTDKAEADKVAAKIKALGLNASILSL